MTRLCDIPPACRWVETVRPGCLCGDTDEVRCPDDRVWSDTAALVAWLKHRSDNTVGFRRFAHDLEGGKTYLDPGWVYFRGMVIPKGDVLSGKAERDDPRFPATGVLMNNLKDNDWDCLWIATYCKVWPFERDRDVFVDAVAS